jgi:hypothetical protein
MSSSAELACAYAVGNAPMQVFPFPHIYVRDVFPRDYYEQLRAKLPPAEVLKPITQARNVHGPYDERFVLGLTPEELAKLPDAYRAFWSDVAAWMLGGRFAQLVLGKFAPFIEQRFQGMSDVQFADEALLVEDRTRYALGPHTDTPAKVVSMLFYLPADESQSHLGTSIYVPKDPQFTCGGGPHHAFERFDRMATMPFVPNSVFAFVKTANSFHGVEPIGEDGVRRHLLLYDIRLARAPSQPAPAPPGHPKATFSF